MEVEDWSEWGTLFNYQVRDYYSLGKFDTFLLGGFSGLTTLDTAISVELGTGARVFFDHGGVLEAGCRLFVGGGGNHNQNTASSSGFSDEEFSFSGWGLFVAFGTELGAAPPPESLAL